VIEEARHAECVEHDVCAVNICQLVLLQLLPPMGDFHIDPLAGSVHLRLWTKERRHEEEARADDVCIQKGVESKVLRGRYLLDGQECAVARELVAQEGPHHLGIQVKLLPAQEPLQRQGSQARA